MKLTDNFNTKGDDLVCGTLIMNTIAQNMIKDTI